MNAMGTVQDGGLARGAVWHNHVLAVTLLIVTEVMLFSGLVAGYLVLRVQAVEWPPPGQPRLPLEVTGINTLVLFASGYFLWQVQTLLRAGELVKLRRRMVIALALGSVFLVIQGVEWVFLIGHGLTTSSSVYGSTFYTIVGCHALHVMVGLVAVGVVARRVIAATSQVETNHSEADFVARQSGPILGARLFWLFVVGVWPPLYLVVYLW